MKHRGFTHDPFFLGSLSVLLYLLNPLAPEILSGLWVPFAVGWASHILADLFTDHGIPFLNWHVKLPVAISTTGPAEPMARMAMALSVLFLWLPSFAALKSLLF